MEGLLDRVISEAGVVALTVPDDHAAGMVAKVLSECIFLKHRSESPGDTILLARKTASAWSHEAVLETLNLGRAVFGISADERTIPETLMRAADCKLDLAPLDAEAVGLSSSNNRGLA